MIYQLKPLKQFKQHDGSVLIISPTHEYIIRDNQVNYLNIHSKQTGIKYCQSFSECLDWINDVHVPSKLSEFFNVMELNHA